MCIFHYLCPELFFLTSKDGTPPGPLYVWGVSRQENLKLNRPDMGGFQMLNINYDF